MINIALDDANFENKHPRDNDGRFSSWASLTGKELGSYKSIKELRQKAVDYYKNNLQGTTVKNKNLGSVLFSGKGLRKFIASSADEVKLKMILAIPSIIEKGEYSGAEKPSHTRTDSIVKFHRIGMKVFLGGKKYRASVLVGEDAAGNKFYNLNPDAEHYVKDETPRIPAVQWRVRGASIDSIGHKDTNVKFLFKNRQAMDELLDRVVRKCNLS